MAMQLIAGPSREILILSMLVNVDTSGGLPSSGGGSSDQGRNWFPAVNHDESVRRKQLTNVARKGS